MSPEMHRLEKNGSVIGTEPQLRSAAAFNRHDLLLLSKAILSKLPSHFPARINLAIFRAMRSEPNGPIASQHHSLVAHGKSPGYHL